MRLAAWLCISAYYVLLLGAAWLVGRAMHR